VTVDEFFANQAEARLIFEAVLRAVEEIGPVELRVSKSQVAFRRSKNFAMVWMPEQYLRRKAAPLVLTISFRRRDDSPRWKEIVEPAPGRFTHHLELYSPDEVDDTVKGWLRAAWEME
jgi:hypothetical protein